MQTKTKTAALSALKWAAGLTAGFIIGHTVVILANGQGDTGGMMAEKLVVGIALFPILFFCLWAWGTFSKKDPLESKSTSSPKKQTFSWKALIVAIIVAMFLNVFISAAAGIEPRKNIIWTVLWIYLSIEAWKSWKWKALLPYPLYLVLTIISFSVVSTTGFNYLSWTHIAVAIFLNFGGLLTFYLLLRRTQNNQEIVAVQNRTKRDKQVVGDTESDFKKPIINTFPERIKVKKAHSHSLKKEPSKMKEKNDITINENKLYKQIWKEIEENETDVGLWANCFSNCEGDENKTKALYVKKRVLVLKENLQKQLIEQEREAKIKAEKEVTNKLLDQKRKVKKESEKATAQTMKVFEGRADNIEIFKKTLDTMPTFFPNILEQFGYKLDQDRNRQEKWSIFFPSCTGARYVYNLDDLRTAIIKIVVNNND